MDISELMATYATKEVMTVMAAIGVAVAGWKAASKTWGVVSSFAQKASFMGFVSGMLLLSGLGVTGLGIGELESRSDTPTAENSPLEAAALEEAIRPGIKNDELVQLLTGENHVSVELTKEVLDYARNRDGFLPDEKLLELAQESPEALTALIDLMKIREERIAKQIDSSRENAVAVSAAETSSDPFAPVSLTSYDSSQAEAYELVEADEAVIKNADSMMSKPMAWLCIMLGIGASGSGITCFLCRNNRRNEHDPHYRNVRA